MIVRSTHTRDIWWFQPRAIDAIQKAWKSGAKRVVLVSPPGSGKTEMAAVMARKFKRPVCIVHTLVLKRNALTRLCETYTVQQILAAGKIPGERPDLVIWDECHHSAGEQWGTVLDLVPRGCLVLGLTGTPQRADGKALDRFDEMVVAAHYSELLMAGTIVPYRCIHPEEFRDGAMPDLAAAWRKYGEKKKSIFYCRDIEHADETAKALGKIAAAWHSGLAWRGDEGRDAVLKRFEQSELKCLVTVDALTEGFDVPDSECVVLGSKCLNVSTYLQKTGRGGRSSPGKREALLIDAVGAHLRHGPPTEDREYSIHGTGIARKRRGGGHAWDYEPTERERIEYESFDAKFVTGYDWRAPTDEDKRRQLGWIVQLAGRRGWTEDVAKAMFQTVFGEEAPQ